MHQKIKILSNVLNSSNIISHCNSSESTVFWVPIQSMGVCYDLWLWRVAGFSLVPSASGIHQGGLSFPCLLRLTDVPL